MDPRLRMVYSSMNAMMKGMYNNVVVPELKLAFLCRAKCASTSIKRIVLDHLGPYSQRKPKEEDAQIGLNYVSPSKLHQLNRKGDWLVIMVSRNPWDRILSCWHNRVLEKGANFCRNEAKKGIYRRMPFSEFVEIVSKTNDTNANPHYRSQIWGAMHKDRPIWNMRLRFEDLEAEWEEARDEIKHHCGVKVPKLEVLNPSGNSKKNYRNFYSSEAAELIWRRFHKDAEAFGYDFNV